MEIVQSLIFLLQICHLALDTVKISLEYVGKFNFMLHSVHLCFSLERLVGGSSTASSRFDGVHSA